MEKLIPVFEKQTGNTIHLSSGSSMGESPTSIPNRLSHGEHFDMVILAAPELNKLIDGGYVESDTHADLLKSRISALRKNLKKPCSMLSTLATPPAPAAPIWKRMCFQASRLLNIK
jgi:molybdate transport system substrate-binding protein